ncbi:MAG: hypothetical protein ACC662_03975 [Planctomycetota bacterium]
MRRVVWIGGLVLALALGGCGDRTSGTEGGAGETTPSPDLTADMSTPLGSIEYQVALLVAGDVEVLKACFTPRVRDKITAETMAKGAEEIRSMTLDDLFAGVKESEVQGKKTAKVKMKNGRTLTTLILTDGKWLADTIWFK